MDKSEGDNGYEEGARLFDEAAGHARGLWFEIVAENARIPDVGTPIVSTRATERQNDLAHRLRDALANCNWWRGKWPILLESAMAWNLTCRGQGPELSVARLWLPEVQTGDLYAARFDLDQLRTRPEDLRELAFALRLVADRFRWCAGEK